MLGASDKAAAAEPTDSQNDFTVAAATVGIICVGAALFEAALIPGMVIGVAAMLAPKALPMDAKAKCAQTLLVETAQF